MDNQEVALGIARKELDCSTHRFSQIELRVIIQNNSARLSMQAVETVNGIQKSVSMFRKLVADIVSEFGGLSQNSLSVGPDDEINPIAETRGQGLVEDFADSCCVRRTEQ